MMNARRAGILAATVIWVVLTAGSGMAANAPLRVGSPVPSVRLTALSGQTVRLPEQIRGKAAIIHFWSAGCSSTCKEEMATLEDFSTTYKNRGLAVVAITVGQRAEEVRAYLNGIRITFPVLIDADRKAAQQYDVVDLPRTFILDKSGLIRYKIIGSTTEGALRKMVLSLL